MTLTSMILTIVFSLLGGSAAVYRLSIHCNIMPEEIKIEDTKVDIDIEPGKEDRPVYPSPGIGQLIREVIHTQEAGLDVKSPHGMETHIEIIIQSKNIDDGYKV